MSLTKLVLIENDHAVTTSIKVSTAFGKQHKNVIQKLEGLECSEKFNRLNFQPVEYLDKKGESRKSYTMTKDGFMFLVMGFTGKKAASIKEAFIAKFNEMEAKLRTPANTLPYQPLTPGQQRHIQQFLESSLTNKEKML